MTIDKLEEHKRRMIDYLKMRLDLEDWHGVQDAASDIREIDAQLRLLKEMQC